MRYLILGGLIGLMAPALAAKFEMPRSVRVGVIQSTTLPQAKIR